MKIAIWKKMVDQKKSIEQLSNQNIELNWL